MIVRWGILSAANIAKQQVMPAIVANGGKIQAIASRSQTVKDLVEQYEIEHVYTTYEALLASDLDAVYIALPNSLHFEWVMKALEHGKHVLVEKPIVLDVQQMIAIKEKAEANHLIVMEAFMYRFHPQIEATKKMIDAGEIGEIVSMRSQFHFVLDDWEKDIRIRPNLGGGVLYDIGCYCLNIQQYMLGDKIENAKLTSLKRNDVDVKVAGQIKYKKGVIGTVDCSFYGYFTATFDVIGTKGMLRLPYAFRTDVNNHVGVVEVHKENGVQQYKYEGNAYRLQIAHFEQAIQGQSVSYSLERITEQVQSLVFLHDKL